MMSNNINIHIEWEGPYRLNQLSELNDVNYDYGI